MDQGLSLRKKDLEIYKKFELEGKKGIKMPRSPQKSLSPRKGFPTSGRQSQNRGKLQVSYWQSTPSLYSSPYTDTDKDRFLSKTPKTPAKVGGGDVLNRPTTSTTNNVRFEGTVF